MPELPEVETIKRGLSQKVVGLTIVKIDVFTPKSFQADIQKVLGKKVLNIERRAKVLRLNLDNKNVLLIHLKMSGQLIWIGVKGQGPEGRFSGGHPTQDMILEMPNKSTRVVFEFDDGSHLYFNDQRKFGWIKYMTSTEVTDSSFFQGLGPEPLEDTFTWQILKEQLSKHKNWPVKVTLLDQQVISGIGNIYASEALFRAKIDPRTPIRKLTDGQIKKLHSGIIQALSDGITYGGSSRTSFVNAEGKKGLFLDYAHVYQRAGEPCKICGTQIQIIKQGGRSSFFCPKCQK